jgi:predicted DsbA family dithiol-disulfide isomerase
MPEAAAGHDQRLVIPVYYDFASTLCYVAHRVMERMAGDLERLAIDLVWQPFDLTRITGWQRGAVVDGARRDNVLRVLGDLDVPARMPARWMDSRALNAVALAVEGTPKEPVWRERVWSAIYEEGRVAESHDDIARLAADLDIDLEVLPDCTADLEERTRRAAERGVGGVPTFMLDVWPFAGIQEDRTMRSFLERFAKTKRAESVATD